MTAFKQPYPHGLQSAQHQADCEWPPRGRAFAPGPIRFIPNSVQTFDLRLEICRNLRAHALTSLKKLDLAKPSYAKNSVDINRNDVTNTLGAVVNLPIAILLRGFISAFPETGNAIARHLPHTNFGTGDRHGLSGAIVGNNDGKNDGMPSNPGVFGLAMSLAHAQLIWGNEVKFEREGDGHDLKTGAGQKSDSGKSSYATLGEGFGILAKRFGVGREFFDLMHDQFGPIRDDYSFLAGVRDGALPEKSLPK